MYTVFALIEPLELYYFDRPLGGGAVLERPSKSLLFSLAPQSWWPKNCSRVQSNLICVDSYHWFLIQRGSVSSIEPTGWGSIRAFTVYGLLLLTFSFNSKKQRKILHWENGHFSPKWLSRFPMKLYCQILKFHKNPMKKLPSFYFPSRPLFRTMFPSHLEPLLVHWGRLLLQLPRTLTCWSRRNLAFPYRSEVCFFRGI